MYPTDYLTFLHFQSASDSQKPVSISSSQPKTKPELVPFLFEGDIFLNEKQATSLLNHLSENKKRRRSLSSDPEAIWDEFPIKYRFHESMSKILFFGI